MSIDIRIFYPITVQTTMEQVLVTFPISKFGYMPIVMTQSVWQEIFDAYQDQVLTTLDDDNGETVEIDLCESVQSAVVELNPSDDMIIWASALDTQSFMNSICLEHDLNNWGLQLEMNHKVAQLFSSRGATYESAKAISLGTVQMQGNFGGEITITLKYVDKKKHCTVQHEAADELVFGDDYLERLKAYFDDVEIVEPIQVAVVEDKVEIDLSAFDNIPASDDQ